MTGNICITGAGVCSAVGNDVETFARSLKEGITGIRRHEKIFDKPIWAALVNDLPTANYKGDPAKVDRAALLAVDAAKQAWADAFRDNTGPDSARVGLVLGTSHGGRSQLDDCVEDPSLFENGCGARKILMLSPHYQQTDIVAYQLGIHGPVATISSACSSGGAALAFAVDLLETGRADYVLAGGMDGFSKITFAGFAALGAVADMPCGPFSQTIGITVGEGSAVVVLERVETARRRGAPVYAELLACGSSWDGYHITEPDPTGEGILRSAQVAADKAGINFSVIDYINVHGTGTRANDAAETMSLKRMYAGGEKAPPASSTKSFTGHTLGASAVMGLLSATLAMRHSLIPPTVNFTGPRPGCNLDFVPNAARSAEVSTFLCQSAGFGGVNTVIIGSKLHGHVRKRAPKRENGLKITGMGVISSIGLDRHTFQESLRAGHSGIAPIERFRLEAGCQRKAGLVKNFDPRRIMPTLNMRRLDLGIQYGAAAASQAMADARFAERGLNLERVGLVVGTTRGASASFQNFLASVNCGNWSKASAAHFPNLVMSSIGGYISKALGLRGIASTTVGGTGWGVQTLLHASELLRQSEAQEAMVVVIVDELSALFFRLFEQMGWLAASDSALGEVMAPYHQEASGMILGEGAVAFTLERMEQGSPSAGCGYAEIKGYGWTADASGSHGASLNGEWLATAMTSAMNEAGLSRNQIDAVYGCGRGLPSADLREARALKSAFGTQAVPISCITGNTGLSEAACGGFAIAAALCGMKSGEVYPIVGPYHSPGETFSELDFVRGSGRSGTFRNTLVIASTDNGNNAAVVLGTGHGSIQ